MATDPIIRDMHNDTCSCYIYTNAKMNLMMYSTHREERYVLMAACDAVSGRALFRNVWKIYLDQEKFELAKKYAAVSERGGGGERGTFIYCNFY